MAALPFVIQPSLCAIAVAYRQDELIADQVLPRVPVYTETFRYIQYAQGEQFTSPDPLVGRKGAPNQVDFSSTEATATTKDYGLDAPVPNADQIQWLEAHKGNPAAVSQVDPQSRAAERVTGLVMTKREQRAANLLFSTASYAAGNQSTLSGTSQWSDFANSDPLNAIKTAFDNMIMRPNIGVIGQQVATQMLRHPKLASAIFKFVTTGASVTIDNLREELELDELYVGKAWINTAAKGQTASLSRLWGKHASFFRRDKTADTQGGVTFGMTAQFGSRVAGTIEDADIGIRGGVRVRVAESVVELVTANDLGYIFANAVA